MLESYFCRAVTVYCSSSNHVDVQYLETAKEMGKLIAANDYTLVFGGGKLGLMGKVSEGALENGGKVHGIILKNFMDLGVADTNAHEMDVVEDMRTRKRCLDQAGDAYIALPGGFGTFEEITEMISFKQLGFHNKPIILINVNGYFNHLINQFEHAFNEKFIENRFKDLYQVANTPQQAIDGIKCYKPSEYGLKYKLLETSERSQRF